MRFIKTVEGRLINTSRIAFAESNNDMWFTELYDHDGEPLGRIKSSQETELLNDRFVIPDTRYSVLVEFWEEGAALGYMRHAVLAWFIESDWGAEPILCEALPDVWCLEMTTTGDVSWFFPVAERHCQDFATAKAVAMEIFAMNKRIEEGRAKKARVAQSETK